MKLIRRQSIATNTLPLDVRRARRVSSVDSIEGTEVLGSGGFGTCYEAIYKNMRVCIKRLNRTSKRKAQIESFQAETREEIFEFDHPNIGKLFAASKPSKLQTSDVNIGSLTIVYEYIEGCSLQSVIDNLSESIDLSRMSRISTEIASALNYVHGYKIAHLDLKPANVMCTKQGVCKLIDFGCSQYIRDDPATPSRSMLTGTFAYRAPELLKGGSPSAKCDAYSIGKCMLDFMDTRLEFYYLSQALIHSSNILRLAI